MKYIAVDCDGVLLEWREAFKEWMNHRGYDPLIPESQSYWLHELYGITHREITKLIGYFNSSAQIGFLESCKNALPVVRQLAAEDYRFVCITSLGDDEYAARLREQNLRNAFGDVFEEIVCLHYRIPKKGVLEKLHEKYDFECWVEDHVANANAGPSLGIRTFLMDYPYNQEGVSDSITRVDCWGKIYKEISGNK